MSDAVHEPVVEITSPVVVVDAPPRRPLIARPRELALRALPLLGLLAVWWALTTFMFDRPRIYPPPLDVWDEVVRILSGDGPLGSTYAHAGATLYRLAVSFVLAFVLGTLGGIAAGRQKWFFDFTDNLVWIAMTVPSVVWVFIFVIAIGISNVVPILALIVLLTPPVFIAVAEGAKAVPQQLTTMARSYHVGPWQRLTGVYLPSVIPYMAGSARVTFALGIKIVIIAEVVGLPTGIGLLIKYWSDTLYMAPVVAWGLLLTAGGVAIDLLVFKPIERRATRYVTGSATASTTPSVTTQG